MRLLDLFCGAGGAAMGYSQAGFEEITGVVINPQPRYPFKFVQADALLFLEIQMLNLGSYDLIHASPPCQEHVALSVNRWGKDSARWPDLIAPTRKLLETTEPN